MNIAVKLALIAPLLLGACAKPVKPDGTLSSCHEPSKALHPTAAAQEFVVKCMADLAPRVTSADYEDDVETISDTCILTAKRLGFYKNAGYRVVWYTWLNGKKHGRRHDEYCSVELPPKIQDNCAKAGWKL